jgi:HlyD family secretion protein
MDTKISFLSLLLVTAACTQNNGVVSPRVKPLIEAVYASGFIVAQDEYEVFAQVDGYLVDKMVNDGDEVKKGDVLFVIEDRQQSARHQVARENYELARRNYGNSSPVLEELNATVASAKTKMQFDSVNYTRYSNLLKQNATSRIEFDRAKLQYESARNDYTLQRSRLEKTRNQLRLESQNAASQLQIAGNETDRYTIRSEVNGKVFKTLKERGELIRRNEVIAVVGQDDHFYLQLSIDELDIQRVKKGQQAMVKVDAYPGKVFQATIDKIYPMVNQQQQSLRTDATFNEPLPGAYSGLAVEANVIIRQKDRALVIPKTALLPGDSVLIRTDDGDKKIRVSTGIETLDEIEIVQGLDSTQRLLVQR